MSIVLYGNPSNGIYGRTWGDAVFDIASGMCDCISLMDNMLAPHDDHVSAVVFNGVQYDPTIGIDTAINSPDSLGVLHNVGILTKDGLSVQIAFTPEELINTLYMPIYDDIREPGQIATDWLVAIFKEQFDDNYT